MRDSVLINVWLALFIVQVVSINLFSFIIQKKEVHYDIFIYEGINQIYLMMKEIAFILLKNSLNF